MPLQQLTRKKLLFNNTTYLCGKNSHNMESCCNHRGTHCNYQDILHDSCKNCSHKQHRIHFSHTLSHQPAYLSPELHHLCPDKKKVKEKNLWSSLIHTLKSFHDCFGLAQGSPHKVQGDLHYYRDAISICTILIQITGQQLNEQPNCLIFNDIVNFSKSKKKLKKKS